MIFTKNTEDSEVHSKGAHPLYGALMRLGLHPIKLAYKPRRLDGRFKLTASTLNRLQLVCQQFYAELAISSPAVADPIASTH